MDNYDVFVGRQPIFDRNENIYAYELLHRIDDSNKFPAQMNAEDATLQLLINTFLTIGKEQILGETKSFINFSETLLVDDVIGQLDPKSVAIEILENVPITNELIKKLREYQKEGFTIVLDDFVMNDPSIDYLALFKAVHIIKIDFLHTPKTMRVQMERIFKQFPHLSLLAEKVETEEEYKEALKDGYHLFQGYYFAKPEIVKGSDIPTNQALHFHLFQMLSREDVDINEVAQLIEHDLSLSYKLLRYINSLTFNIQHEIKSIKQTIMLIGLNETKKWIRILLFRDLAKGKGREKAVINSSLLRAKTSELLAKHKGKKDTDKFFLAGMFSMINVIMKQEWEDILKQLNFTDEINKTLTGEETEITPYLRLSEAIEKLNMEDIEHYASVLNIEQAIISYITFEANQWTTKFM